MNLKTMGDRLKSLERLTFGAFCRAVDAHEAATAINPTHLSFSYGMKETLRDVNKDLLSLMASLEEDSIDTPFPDFNTKNEIANLAHKVGEIGDRVASLEVSRTNHNQGCETFWASLAETLQAYRSYGPTMKSQAVAEVLDIIIRANKETNDQPI